MRTIHTAPLLRLTPDDEPTPDGAVLVLGNRIGAIGSRNELTGAYPQVRVRRWAGTLGPALVHDGPLPPAPSPRERVHALFRLGVAAVLAAHVAEPDLRAAAARNEVAVLENPRPPALVPAGRADLAVFADDGTCLATVVAGRLVHRRAYTGPPGARRAAGVVPILCGRRLPAPRVPAVTTLAPISDGRPQRRDPAYLGDHVCAERS